MGDELQQACSTHPWSRGSAPPASICQPFWITPPAQSSHIGRWIQEPPPPSRGSAARGERGIRSGRHDGHRRCRAHPAGRRRDDQSRRRPPGPTVKASANHPVLPAALKALPWKDVPSTAAVEPLTCSTGGARSNRRTELTRAPACAGSHSRRTRSAGPLVTCTRHLGAQSD